MKNPSESDHLQRLTIALVEDEPTQSFMISTLLESAGFIVAAFADGASLLRNPQLREMDLILLDWELPAQSGLQVMQALREDGIGIPVVFLTGSEDERRVVEALSVGADDYVLKPPRAAELAARIRAVVRRASSTVTVAQVLDCHPYRFDPANRQLRINGELVATTAREFELARHFFANAGQTISRHTLLVRVWRTSPNVTTRTIDTFVSRLRKRIGLDGSHGWKLEALYQQGYRLVAHDAETPPARSAEECVAG
jgi:two-component system response regulator RegX3